MSTQESIAEEGEIAHNAQFLLFQQCFQRQFLERRKEKEKKKTSACDET